MKRKPFLLISLLVVLLLTMLLFQVSFAEEPEPLPVFVFWNGGSFKAESADQPIRLIRGWGTMTRGQIVAFRNHEYATYLMRDESGKIVLDLSAEDAEQYWGPATPANLGLDCPMPTQWLTMWEYPSFTLPPGEYTLESTSVTEKPFNDGFHVCTYDGDPVGPTPSLSRPGEIVATLTIEVPE